LFFGGVELEYTVVERKSSEQGGVIFIFLKYNHKKNLKLLKQQGAF